MIRLIASDIDGTLLPEGTSHLDPELFTVIRKLKEKGIRFAAASGREYPSVRHLFAPVAEDILFMVENGACTVEHEKVLYEISLERGLVEKIIRFMRREPSLLFYTISGCMDSYTETDNEEFIRRIETGYGLAYRRVEDLMKVSASVLKCAMYGEGDAAALAHEARAAFGSSVNITPSGAHWVDFCPLGADKGTGLRKMQEMLGVSPEETMAFGDNTNDVPMLLAAGESYAVEEGRQEARDAAKHSAGRMREGGVLRVLKSLL